MNRGNIPTFPRSSATPASNNQFSFRRENPFRHGPTWPMPLFFYRRPTKNKRPEHEVPALRDALHHNDAISHISVTAVSLPPRIVMWTVMFTMFLYMSPVLFVALMFMPPGSVSASAIVPTVVASTASSPAVASSAAPVSVLKRTAASALVAPISKRNDRRSCQKNHQKEPHYRFSHVCPPSFFAVSGLILTNTIY